MSPGNPVRDDASEPAPLVSPGDILAGKYRVDRVLGVGGMGMVVAATHVDLLEPRAIKLMLPKHLGDGEAVERFLREARACARLKGEHVTKVHDVGKLENGAPYMIMEHLTGADLGNELERRGPLPPAEAALYVLEACEALAEAHAAGIVHRDLKPENLFLARGPTGIASIKVLDFGISLVLDKDRELRMTNTSTIMGSPYYMSPEQARSSRNVDARTDIWSLGVVLHQLLTGEPPFTGNNIAEVITAVLFGAIPAPSTIVRGLPEGLDAVVLRCLERDLERRYASVSELAAALAPFASSAGKATLERTLLLLPLPAQRAGDPSFAVTGASWHGSAPRAYLGFAVGLALAVALGGAAFAYHRSNASRREEPVVAITATVAAPSVGASSAVIVSPSAEATAAPTVVPSSSAAPEPPPVTSQTTRRPSGPPAKSATPKPTSAQPASPPPPADDPFGSGRR